MRRHRSDPKRGGVRLRVEALEDRTVPACVFTVQPGGVGGGFLLKIKCIDDNDTVTINDNGSGAVNNVTVGAFSPGQAISEIRVQGKGGRDRVTYNLTGNLQGTPGPGLPRLLDVDLGQDNDRFTANLAGNDLDARARLEISVRGGGDHDVLSVNAANTSVGEDARLRLDLDGGADDDTIRVLYQGTQDGTLQLNAHGAAGDDVVSADITIDAGSNGTGPPAAGALALGEIGNAAVVRGNAGKDRLRFRVVNNSNLGVLAEIGGDGGKDLCAHTANVSGFSCETDSILP